MNYISETLDKFAQCNDYNLRNKLNYNLNNINFDAQNSYSFITKEIIKANELKENDLVYIKPFQAENTKGIFTGFMLYFDCLKLCLYSGKDIMKSIKITQKIPLSDSDILLRYFPKQYVADYLKILDAEHRFHWFKKYKNNTMYDIDNIIEFKKIELLKLIDLEVADGSHFGNEGHLAQIKENDSNQEAKYTEINLDDLKEIYADKKVESIKKLTKKPPEWLVNLPHGNYYMSDLKEITNKSKGNIWNVFKLHGIKATHEVKGGKIVALYNWHGFNDIKK